MRARVVVPRAWRMGAGSEAPLCKARRFVTAFHATSTTSPASVSGAVTTSRTTRLTGRALLRRRPAFRSAMAASRISGGAAPAASSAVAASTSARWAIATLRRRGK